MIEKDPSLPKLGGAGEVFPFSEEFQELCYTRNVLIGVGEDNVKAVVPPDLIAGL